nr:adenylate kinase [Nakamurella flavida]
MLIVGPQGVGKGTQATRLAKALDIAHISTGDIFRANVGEKTELGLLAQKYMSQGDLVPDEVTNSMVADRLDQQDAAEGFLLDGFPRNLDQARWLGELLGARGQSIDAVLLLEAPTEVLMDRLVSRAREDDTPEAIRKRLDIYHTSTTPLLEYYHDRVLAVNGVGGVDEVTQRALAALHRRSPSN